MSTWIPNATSSNALSEVLGVGILLPFQLSNVSLLQTGRFTTSQPALRDNIIVQVKKFGTPTADCSIVVDWAGDDGATNFSPGIILPNAEITYSDSDASGKVYRLPTLGKFYRLRLLAGTMTGANGFNIWTR